MASNQPPASSLPSLFDLRGNNTKLIELANSKGQIIKNKGIKTNQLRNIFEAIYKLKVNYTAEKLNTVTRKDAEKNLINNLQMLRAKLAYAKGKKPEMECIRAIFDPLIEQAKDYEDFETIYKLLEGIISYHKYYGGN